MRRFVFDSYDLMSERSADIVMAEIYQDRRVNLSLTGASTPQRMYEILIERLKDMEALDHVYFYTFDETPIRNKEGLVVGYDNYDAYKKQFLEPANINPSRVIAMNDDNYDIFPELITQAGGLDLMLIGMGSDGHFCANMPECTQIDKEVYRVELSDEYSWNKPYQDSLGDHYSDYMYTLGLPALMKAKRVVLIVSGESKAEAVYRMLYDPIDEKFPASYLRLVPNLVMLMDKEAASRIESVQE